MAPGHQLLSMAPFVSPPNNKVSSRQICVLKHPRPKLLNTCNVCNFWKWLKRLCLWFTARLLQTHLTRLSHTVYLPEQVSGSQREGIFVFIRSFRLFLVTFVFRLFLVTFVTFGRPSVFSYSQYSQFYKVQAIARWRLKHFPIKI